MTARGWEEEITARAMAGAIFLASTYDSFPVKGQSGDPWRVVGGTSVSAPSLAGIINSAGSFCGSSAAELTAIYATLGQGAGYSDIQSGNCYRYAGYLAEPGWDYCSGVGSVRGYQGK